MGARKAADPPFGPGEGIHNSGPLVARIAMNVPFAAANALIESSIL